MHGEVKLPDTWPEPPHEMSVSSLRVIESCPRRWALSNASYPYLWQGSGYPPQTQRSWIMGSIVHLAIERVVRRLAQANCGSLSDPCAPGVIRELGGFTSIIRSCIKDTVASQAENPRQPDIAELQMSLERSISRMRVDVKSLLRTIPLVPATESQASACHRGSLGPLRPGTYAELQVHAPELHWRGIVDLLVLGPAGACEIRDFKTGAHSEDHQFQIRAYAVLWSADRQLNPSGSLATKLTISYPTGDVTVPAPSVEDVDAIKAELLERATVREAGGVEASPGSSTRRRHVQALRCAASLLGLLADRHPATPS